MLHASSALRISPLLLGMMIFLPALSGLYRVASITALRMQLCKLCGKTHGAR
jgi:hypothetical protein